MFRPEPGVTRCHKCGWLFVSPDPERVRRCADCKQAEETYTPRTASLVKAREAVRSTEEG